MKERHVTAYPSLIAFSVACSTILLQLVQTRIFSVVFWNHVVYFIISIALLGYGISGTWLSFGRSTFIARRLTLPVAATCCVVAILVSTLVAPRLGVSLGDVFSSGSQLGQLLLTYFFAVLPYFFAGWILGVVYRDHAERIHTLYFADLVGAGLGCLIFLAGMRPVGAINLVVLAALLVAVPVYVSVRRSPSVYVQALVVLAAAAVLIPFSASINRAIVPERTKAIMENFANLEEGDEKVVEFTEWNPISRIDVAYSKQRPEFRRIYIDGDAWTNVVYEPVMPPEPFDPEKDVLFAEGSPYLFHHNPENVLVIGSGGGTDVWLALRAGAEHVDAVEINPTTARIGVEEYAEINNGLFLSPRVTVWTEDGRSFVRRSDQQYDVIMIHGIDTFNALSAGAYILSENYLYTLEAMKEYLSHLAPGGALCISRWRHHAEGPRLFALALEALDDLGVENPENNILVHAKGVITFLVRTTPFTDAEADRLYREIKKKDLDFIYPPREGEPVEEEQQLFVDYAEAFRAGEQAALLQELPFDISVVTDDSPFFFHFDKPSNLLNVFQEKEAMDLIRGHWASFTLVILFACTLLAVTLFMFLPLMRLGRTDLPNFGGWLVFFGAIGVAFIFVEIALMQRFALLLGHPSRSLALVLASLLFFAGVGSFANRKFQLSLPGALTAACVVILAAAFLYPAITAACLGLPLGLRGAVTVALVAVPAFFMGMPFPTGIREIAKFNDAAVPWMWGVNGGTTVLASVLAIILAIWTNFTTVLVLGAAAYAFAAVVFIRTAKSTR